MITGDAKDTAKNIAIDSGIIENANDIVLDSKEFKNVNKYFHIGMLH